VPLNGLTTPSWSPDGKQLVFTGYDGGLSDLFVVNADGTNLHRLTNDKYADLEPSVPDGKTIAFVTDRSHATDFEALKFGNLRIALFHLDKGSIDILRNMDQGKNINPAWAPDGRSLAFVSDRNGISNIFLYDLSDGKIYQLTDVFTGVSGITALSPCLSWRTKPIASRSPTTKTANTTCTRSTTPARSNGSRTRHPPRRRSPRCSPRNARARWPAAGRGRRDGDRRYAAPRGNVGVSLVHRFRLRQRAADPDSGAGPAPVSVRSLIDSSPALPDTSEFTFKAYHTGSARTRGAAHDRLRTG